MAHWRRCRTGSSMMALPRKVFILVLFLVGGTPLTIGSITRSSSTGLMGVRRRAGAPVGPSRSRGLGRSASRPGGGGSPGGGAVRCRRT
ncbi:hypothetical protein FRACA_3020002 [Frankia canadensis]|uniref:Uncharacterized protein n=1 Tax=Frankia canadensis TaxID=1836972 RepID=A0A2I2KU36_9ACTN|nr:hypothetical protein FRACA_3020002 [Frankia canadensis]SOU56468.1 hypothetical protein FRACA_3020002 [Frankia canadensis]